MATFGVNCDDSMLNKIDSQLSYGDSRSGWVRSAIRMRFAVEPLLDQIFDSHEKDAKLEFLEEAVREKVNKEMESA